MDRLWRALNHVVFLVGAMTVLYALMLVLPNEYAHPWVFNDYQYDADPALTRLLAGHADWWQTYDGVPLMLPLTVIVRAAMVGVVDLFIDVDPSDRYVIGVVGLYALGIWAVAVLGARTWERRAALGGVLAATTIWWPPMTEALRYGHPEEGVSALVLGAAGLALYQGRERLAALLAACAIWSKQSWLLLAAVLPSWRPWRAWLVPVAIVGVVSAVSVISSIGDVVGSNSTLAVSDSASAENNATSLYHVLGPDGWAHDHARLLVLLCSAFVGGLWWLLRRRGIPADAVETEEDRRFHARRLVVDLAFLVCVLGLVRALLDPVVNTYYLLPALVGLLGLELLAMPRYRVRGRLYRFAPWPWWTTFVSLLAWQLTTLNKDLSPLQTAMQSDRPWVLAVTAAALWVLVGAVAALMRHDAARIDASTLAPVQTEGQLAVALSCASTRSGRRKAIEAAKPTRTSVWRHRRLLLYPAVLVVFAAVLLTTSAGDRPFVFTAPAGMYVSPGAFEQRAGEEPLYWLGRGAALSAVRLRGYEGAERAQTVYNLDGRFGPLDPDRILVEGVPSHVAVTTIEADRARLADYRSRIAACDRRAKDQCGEDGANEYRFKVATPIGDGLISINPGSYTWTLVVPTAEGRLVNATGFNVPNDKPTITGIVSQLARAPR